MAHADFVHLRVHSAYSLSEGALKVKDLIKLTGKYQMPAVAITDTANLFGGLEFSQAAKDAGIQPIIGCQLNIRRRDGTPKPGQVLPPDHLIVLVQNKTGYTNAMALVSRAFMDTPSHELPQITLEDLAGASDGLIALSGGPRGALVRLIGEGHGDQAETMAQQLSALFPGRFYVELMRHGLVEEDKAEPGLIDLAYKLDLPLVATNDVFFADAGMYEAHDALLCIAEGTTIANPNRRRLNNEYYFKSAAEMRALFADVPEAVDNTLVIARRCAFMVPNVKPILPPFACADGRDEADELRDMARTGLQKRLEKQVWTADMTDEARETVTKEYGERLEYELDVIVQMGFPGYFLIVADFIQWAKAQGIPVGPGRGSGAGSVVAWALTITDLDPIRFGLLFERFLNPERVSMPDFDIDFCQDRRDEVIRYVQDKYGRDRVAQIITFGKLQARAVLRDVGRVMDMPFGQVDRLCKLVPNNPANPVTLEEAVKGEPMLQAARDDDENVKRLIDTGMKLEGLYRHASTHAAGVVIGDRPLDRLVPLYRDPRSDMPVTQFNMKYVEQAGLVKFDFLGLKTLTVLTTAERIIRQRGHEIDLSHIPLDDAKSFEMLGRGDASGVFQLESTGMRDVLRKMKPDRFEDLIAVVALYRPGPMDNIPSYIARKHGDEEPDYLHPSLEGILKETYGIMIYQEQVMQIAQVLSGYSLGGADLLRRAMGKKIKEEMDAQRKIFVEGAEKNGVDGATASNIFDQVQKFAGYGFNKSHAAAYALVAYQTAYLKANFPVEFFAASMTYDMTSTDKLNLFRGELARLKVPLLGPDVNRSIPHFSVEDTPEGQPAVRYALAAIRNVGEAAMDNLVAERTKAGPFKDLADFANRIDAKQVNRRQLENLVCAGAFDSLCANRAQVFGGIDAILRQAGSAAADRTSNQVSLFGGDVVLPSLTIPECPDWLPNDRLQRELDAVGFYLSAHPLDEYDKVLKRLGAIRQAELSARLAGAGRAVRLAGIVLNRKERVTARGTRMAFVQMSDASGTFEVTLFSEVLAQARDMLEGGRPLLVTAEVQSDGEGVRLTAKEVQPLDQAAESAVAGMRIHLRDTKPLFHLRRLFDAQSQNSRGRGRVSIIVDVQDHEVEIVLKGGYAVSPELRGQVKVLPGIVDVIEI